MSNLKRKMVIAVIVPFFILAVLCCNICSGISSMPGIEHRGTSGFFRQTLQVNAMEHSCCPVSKSNKKCCDGSLNFSAIDPDTLKSQVLVRGSETFKASIYALPLVNSLADVFHLGVRDNSPPKIVQNSVPIYILDRVLRL